MAKDNMPDFKNSRPPKLLDVKKLAEESGMEPPPFQAWRHGDFLVIYVKEGFNCMAVSLEGETFIQRGGPPEILFAMIDALYGVKYRGQRIYPATPQNISDRDFFQQCTTNLTAYLPTSQEADDLETYDDIYNEAREDFLNELIKPPKKDKPS